MKVEAFDGRVERRAVIALVTSDLVLSRLAPSWTQDSLRSPDAALVAAWCVEHFGKYGRAPGKEVEDYFAAWAKSQARDAARVAAVEDLLASLSDEYGKEVTNPDSACDLVAKHVAEVRLEKALEKATPSQVGQGGRRLRLGDGSRG
jgi:hypothetical protein